MKKTILILGLILVPFTAADPENPDNITLELKFNPDSVFVDDETAAQKTYTPAELEYPYIVSDQPLGIVSNSPIESLTYTKATEDIFLVTQRQGSFLLPFTQGGKKSIERREEEVVSREFLNLYNPGFGFETSTKPEVQVRYEFDEKVYGFNRTARGRIVLGVRNRINNHDKLEFELELSG